VLAGSLAFAGCGSGTKLLIRQNTNPEVVVVQSKTPQAGQTLGFPLLATKNTTRVDGTDPIADAAAVARAVYPSDGQATHPTTVTIAPTDDWEAALASAVMMASPVKAPILLSGPGTLPAVTADALQTLAPTGSGAIGGAQVITVGDVPAPKGFKAQAVAGSSPYALTAAIDRLSAAAHGSTASNIVIASADSPAYAMPAAAWAAESGEPILFVNSSGVPQATQQALLSHQHSNLYVLAPPSVISDTVLKQLRRYGTVKRISGTDPADSSVAFAEYRDPPCPTDQPCVHEPGSFGWAMRSPGHGYVLVNANRPLDSAAAAALSDSGSFGPQLLIDNPSTLPTAVLNYFLNYATPGYTQEGPTAAVYNHGWLIGDASAISVAVQAQVDNLLEAVPQK
jgi:hypothetical protein